MLRNVHTYTYAIVNEQNAPIEVTLDCSGSKNMICSTKSPIVKKVNKFKLFLIKRKFRELILAY